MKQCQLMMQTTSVVICWHQGREEGGDDVEFVWLCGGCVADCPTLRWTQRSLARQETWIVISDPGLTTAQAAE